MREPPPPADDAHAHGQADQEIKQLLATVRTNLELVARTWGRESRQHREARAVMRACLEDVQLRRHRRRRRQEDHHPRAEEDEDGDDGDEATGTGKRKGKERGIAGGGGGTGHRGDNDDDVEMDTGVERDRGREIDQDIAAVLAELSLS
ncbi:hypothetical protein AYL99_02339 [Fonsecaea erecta]|uniref:Uncharacterized protein n=1 Tax=Fonsecaea erecta TaxID=1367422 RepID=A0A178ZTN5_9EURO|nr:hypothetical protein AYL99_02339 [Fonsecaea erecta]OAP63112.1 hypothetical protein AYL99_02339 [Fonsecaea erecta]